MLKSLEKLRDGHFGVNGCDSTFAMATDLADEIQAEVNKYYLPRPLFEDGEPADFGDLALVRDNLGEITDMEYQDGKCVAVTISFEGESTATHYMIVDGERLKRPPEPDTQEKIDADLLLTGREYCVKHGLDYEHQNVLSFVVARRDLLARQRKLDGVE